MNITNKDVVQSYIFTTAKYNFDVTEKRILYRLVEIAQSDLKGKKLDDTYTIDKTLFDDRIITLPISSLLKDDNDKHHSRVKIALKKLRNKTFDYEDDKVWKTVGIIEKPIIIKYDAKVIIEINPIIWHAILNFAKGYRKYELETAMQFDSIYTMRFYELFSGQKRPISYTIDNLKIMFQVEDKYKLTANFINRVILPAQKELTAKAPYSFEFKPFKKGKKITSIKFYPVYIAKNRNVNAETKKKKKKISLSWNLDKMTIDYIKQNFLFTELEIKNNIETFKAANNKLDLLLELSILKSKIRDVKNIKGYVIGVLKKKLEEK